MVFAVVAKGPLEWRLGTDLGAFERQPIVLVVLLETAILVYVGGHPRTFLPEAAYGVPDLLLLCYCLSTLSLSCGSPELFRSRDALESTPVHV